MIIKLRHEKLSTWLDQGSGERLDCELILDINLMAGSLEMSSQVFANSLLSEFRFLFDHLPLRHLDELEGLVTHYLFSDGPRLCLPNRLQVESFNLEVIAETKNKPVFKNHHSKSIVLTEEVSKFGRVDVVFETELFGLYRLRIAPGKTIPSHFHAKTSETELVLSNGLQLQGQPVSVGTCISWGKDFVHCYKNTSKEWQVILCIDCPAFDHTDEVQVDHQVDLIAPPVNWISSY